MHHKIRIIIVIFFYRRNYLFDCIDTINKQNYHMALHFGAQEGAFWSKT